MVIKLEINKEIIEIQESLLRNNDKLADFNRKLFNNNGVTVFNLLSSPGSGKTTLLQKTLEYFAGKVSSGVLVGDLETDNDARRLEGMGADVFALNTHGACHLNAKGITTNIANFDLKKLDVFFIENVGNLICPSSFDLGENYRVIMLSTTEGTDKPAKYPPMFNSANVVLINKTDLLPYTDFDIEQSKGFIKNVNPKTEIFEVSCTTGEGLENWFDWFRSKVEKPRQA